jgi:hypothetical protein
MSQKFEHIFKEALQNQEVPYDPAAWNALSSKLDKAMPVSGKKPFNPWAAVIIAVALVGGTSLWYFASDNKPTDNNSSRINQTETKNENKVSPAQTADAKNGNTNEKAATANVLANPTDKTISKGNIQKTSSIPAKSLNSDNLFKEGEYIKDQSSLVTPPNKVYDKADVIPAPPKMNTELTKIENTCQYMDKKVTNSSDIRMTIEFPSGRQVVIDPKESKTVDFEEFGSYKVFNSKGKENKFVVYENKVIDFSIDEEHLFNNGIPTTEVNVSNADPNSNIEWTCKQANMSRSGNKAEFNFFKDGQYTITVSSANEKGCSAFSAKKINITNDYNLMATTAFKPQDIDPRYNTFMPFALVERNTTFTMIVIDPKDGGTIYETTDETAGWNGIDKRTGKPAQHGSNYIWKVSLSNPLPGEAASYKGMVTVIID